MGCNKSKHASVASGNTMKMTPMRRVTAINKKNDSLKRSNIAPLVMSEIHDSGQEDRVNVTKDVEVENVEKTEDGVENLDVEAEVEAKKMDDLGAETEVESVKVKKDDEVNNAEKKALVEVKKVDNVDEEKELVEAKKTDEDLSVEKEVEVKKIENVDEVDVEGVNGLGLPRAVAFDGNVDVLANHLANKGDENAENGEETEEAVAENVIEQGNELDEAGGNAAIDVIENSAGNVTPEAVDVEEEIASGHNDEVLVPAATAEEKCEVAAEEEKVVALADEAEKCDDLPTVEATVEVSAVEVQTHEKDGSASETEEANEENAAGVVTPEAVDVEENTVSKQEDEVQVVVPEVVVEEKCDVAAEEGKVAALADEAEKCDELLTIEATVEVSAVEAQIDENVGSASEKEEQNEDNANEEASPLKTSQESTEEVVIDENSQSAAAAEEVEKNDASVIVTDLFTVGGEDEQGIVKETSEEFIEAGVIVEDPKAAKEEVGDVAGAEPDIETGADVAAE